MGPQSKPPPQTSTAIVEEADAARQPATGANTTEVASSFLSNHESLQMERAFLWTQIAPEFRAVLGMIIITLSIGTVFYTLVEKWGLLDSLYFSVVTLATIGFGDLHPQTRIGKLFTIGYVFVGVGTLGFFFSAVARTSMGA